MAVFVHILPLDCRLISLLLLIEEYAGTAALLVHVFMTNSVLNSPYWSCCSPLSGGIGDFALSSVALIIGRTPCDGIDVDQLVSPIAFDRDAMFGSGFSPSPNPDGAITWQQLLCDIHTEQIRLVWRTKILIPVGTAIIIVAAVK